VKRHTKAPSAQGCDDSKTILGRLFGRFLATRGASSRSGGTGAPSPRQVRIALLSVLLLAVSLLALAPAAFAVEKKVDRYFGGASAGSLGGQFTFPRGIAVNETGAGGAAAGDIYVANSLGQRIDVLNAKGEFKFAFGRDVIAPEAPGDQGVVFEN
jgi:hypothetical protein